MKTRSKIKDMTELPERCDHPENCLGPNGFDLLDQPYRKCSKCGTEICGHDALSALQKK